MKHRRILPIVAVVGFLAVCLVYQVITTRFQAPVVSSCTENHSYVDALARHASLDRYIVLALVD